MCHANEPLWVEIYEDKDNARKDEITTHLTAPVQNDILTSSMTDSKRWMFKLSEWAHFSSYDVGLHSGSTASHILVFDRRTKRLVEEVIDGKIVLSMRSLYQSKVGLTLIDTDDRADKKRGYGDPHRNDRDYQRKRYRNDERSAPDMSRRASDSDSRRDANYDSEKNPRFREKGDSDDEDDDDDKRRRR